jgi:glucose/arabinose dehydrogenase
MIALRAAPIAVVLFGALLIAAVAAKVVGHKLIEDGAAHAGRGAGRAVAKDGALLVSDDTNGVIYRVAYSTSPR